MEETANTLMSEQEAIGYLGISRSSLLTYARNGTICYACKTEVTTHNPHGGHPRVIYEFLQSALEEYNRKRHKNIVDNLHVRGCVTPLLFSRKNPQRKANIAQVLDYLNNTELSIRAIGNLMGVSHETISTVAEEMNYDLYSRREKNRKAQI